MNKYLVWLLAITMTIVIGACAEEELGTPSTPIDSNPVVIEPTEPPTPDDEETVQYLELDSDYLFDQEALYTYELIIPEENLEFINNDPAAEEFVEGSLVFQGDTLSPVGIRYKGSVGAFVGCLTGLDWANPSGSKTCTKLSMKVKTNWEGREEKFYGLNKLQFHAMNLDDSQMRERLGYDLFRSMGVPAPRAVHARLVINGEYNGLFALVEQIDGRFAKENWEDDDGNIYKEAWPLTMAGAPLDEAYYMSALKTNEEDGDVTLMRNFGLELEAAEGIQEVRTVIEKYMNVQEALSYCLVDRMIRHDDGPFHWYCDNVCTNHNYFWYEEPNAEKMHLIAWDLDNAFENIINDANPVTPVADDFGETSNDCEPFRHGAFFLRQWSASCDKLIGGLASYETEYEALKSEFKSGVFSSSEVEEKLARWTEQIREATIEADDLHGDAVSPSSWESSVNTLRQQVDYSRING